MKSACRRALLLTVSISVQLATAARAYGPLGHEIVGGIADERLANPPTATKVRMLLDGAEYCDAQGRVADPDRDKSALPDEGGNTFTLELSDEPPRGRGVHKKKLHGFWDYDAVNALFPEMPGTLRKSAIQAQIAPLTKQLVHEMETHEPKNWRMTANMDIEK